jgi:hypothetical protein
MKGSFATAIGLLCACTALRASPVTFLVGATRNDIACTFPGGIAPRRDCSVVRLAIGACSPMFRRPITEVSSGQLHSHLAVLIQLRQRSTPDVAGSSACEKAVHKLCASWAQDIGVAVSVTSIAISQGNAGFLQLISS